MIQRIDLLDDITQDVVLHGFGHGHAAAFGMFDLGGIAPSHFRGIPVVIRRSGAGCERILIVKELRFPLRHEGLLWILGVLGTDGLDLRPLEAGACNQRIRHIPLEDQISGRAAAPIAGLFLRHVEVGVIGNGFTRLHVGVQRGGHRLNARIPRLVVRFYGILRPR